MSIEEDFILSPTGIAQGTLTLAGSKSYTNRALVLAALCDRPTTLMGASQSDDSRLLATALQELGAKVEIRADQIEVGKPLNLLTPITKNLYCGAAGTTLRFLVAVAALMHGSRVTLSGTERLHERPISELLTALNKLGAKIEHPSIPGYPPVVVEGAPLSSNGILRISGSTSSQFISALLMIAPLVEGGLVLEITNEPVSSSYLDMTINCMAQFGVEVKILDHHKFSVQQQKYRSPGKYFVEGDASAASYFWGLAAITGGTVRVKNLSVASVQGDVQFAQLLEQMGCRLSRGNDDNLPWIEVTGPNQLKAIKCDMTQMPDTAQTLAILCSVADGVSEISGLSTLRHKETDRVSALATELNRVGIKTEFNNNCMKIFGGQPHSAKIETYDDHRMAMSFAVLGSFIEGIEIVNPQVVSKSYPTFWDT